MLSFKNSLGTWFSSKSVTENWVGKGHLNPVYIHFHCFDCSKNFIEWRKCENRLTGKYLLIPHYRKILVGVSYPYQVRKLNFTNCKKSACSAGRFLQVLPILLEMTFASVFFLWGLYWILPWNTACGKSARPVQSAVKLIIVKNTLCKIPSAVIHRSL